MEYHNVRGGNATVTKEQPLEIKTCSRRVDFEFIQLSGEDLPAAISDTRKFVNVLRVQLFPKPDKCRIQYQPSNSTGICESIDIMPGHILVRHPETRIVESMPEEVFKKHYEVETPKTAEK